ncbi:hypothetical protein CRYUN_Cryun21dG0115900 [Craigia yunnanensis]
MNSRKVNTLLIIFVISVAIFSQVRVEATRVLAEDFAKANHLETYSSVYENAKFTMSCWLERLASVPSPRGPVLSHVGVEATRVLPEDFAKADHLDTYSSVYQKAKFTMSYWFERLASGPSPQGPGH